MQHHSTKIQNVYNKWSSTYDDHATHNIAIIKIHPVVIDLLRNESKRDIGLDLGCGTGKITEEASKLSKEVIALDYSDKMLDEAKKKNYNSKVEFLKADLERKLALPDEAFDYVLAILTLHYIKNIGLLYHEIYRILKPGGIFIFDEFVTGPLTQEQKDNPFNVSYDDPLHRAKEKGIKVWSIRKFEEHQELLKNTGLTIEKVIDTYIDEEIKPYILNYKFHKGRVLAKIVLARKPR